MRASPSRFFAASLPSIAISGLLSGAAVAVPAPTALEQVPDGKGGVKWQEVKHVPNQIIGLNERHVLPVTGVDMYGKPMNPFLDHHLYSTYSKGSAPGEVEHGVIKKGYLAAWVPDTQAQE